jgi:hypothetical protein
VEPIHPIGPRPDVEPVRPVVLSPREREERRREREERRRKRREAAPGRPDDGGHGGLDIRA